MWFNQRRVFGLCIPEQILNLFYRTDFVEMCFWLLCQRAIVIDVYATYTAPGLAAPQAKCRPLDHLPPCILPARCCPTLLRFSQILAL